MAILVVYKEGSTRDAAVDALRREGFDVRPAGNAFRAVSELAGRAAECVVLDITSLSERDLDVIPVLHDLAPGVSIIVTFSPAQRELAARALKLGADSYLPEPFYMDELIELVRRATTRLAAPDPAEPPEDLLQRLAADAAHEINNPLQVVQLLHDGVTGRMIPARTKVDPPLKRIGGVGRLLAELGQLPPKNPDTSVDVAALLEEARSHVPDAVETPIEPVSPVEGYPDHLGAVLEGLLRRAAAGGGPVQSSCRDGAVGASPCVVVTIEGPPGRDRTTGAEDPAHGPLFLTFCRIIAHRHGGHIEVEEVPDRGVLYHLLLPSLAPADEEP